MPGLVTPTLSMGDKSKILFPSMGFSYLGTKKIVILGVPMRPWGLLARLKAKKCIFWDKIAKKNQNFLAF